MVYKEIDLTGKNLSNYKITGKLGRGGMATVYKAHELSLNRFVALKVLSAKLTDDEEFIKRFHREAQAAAKLNHPNIVQIFAIGEENGTHFFAMEYVKGKSLSEILKEKKPLTYKETTSIIRQVALGLASAHKEGLVHRDIKPGNILIDKNNNAKIADFGIAYVQDAKTKLTREGSIIGTPEYLSPEQCEGKKLGGQSDIYSLGVTFYELLTGKTPYLADTPVSMIMKIVKGDFPPINEVNPDLPVNLQNIVEKMMKTDLAERYENAEKLIEDLESFENNCSTNAVEKDQGTNVLEKEEISGIVDQYQKEDTSSGSGKRAFLFISIIILVLVATGIAAKFLYFDKLDKKDPAIETKSEEITITEKTQKEEQINGEKSEGKTGIVENEIAADKTDDKEKTEIIENEIAAGKTDDEENKNIDDNVNTVTGNETKKEIDSKTIESNEPVVSDTDNKSRETNDTKDKEPIKNIIKSNDTDPEINKNNDRSNLEKEKIVKKKEIRRTKKKAEPLPPERSFIISLNGNDRSIELISSYIQNRLQKKKYIIIDPVAAEGKHVKNIARSHMIISVRNMGTNTLKYYGSETTEYIISISVKIISPENGRIVKGPVNRTVRYTSLNIDENLQEAADKIIASLSL